MISEFGIYHSEIMRKPALPLQQLLRLILSDYRYVDVLWICILSKEAERRQKDFENRL